MIFPLFFNQKQQQQENYAIDRDTAPKGCPG